MISKDSVSYLARYGLALLPGIFMVNKEWLIAGVTLCVLFLLFNFEPKFILYRKTIKGFARLIIIFSILNLAIGVLVLMYPQARTIAAYLWAILTWAFSYQVMKERVKSPRGFEPVGGRVST